jgi:hypothetical protein
LLLYLFGLLALLHCFVQVHLCLLFLVWINVFILQSVLFLYKYAMRIIFCCAIFVDIIICVLFVGWGQSISCDNFLFNPIAVLFAIKIISQFNLLLFRIFHIISQFSSVFS